METMAAKTLHAETHIKVHSFANPSSPTEFWVVCDEDVKQMEVMTANLKNYYLAQENARVLEKAVKVGKVYVLNDQDNIWRRVLIEFVGEKEVDVRDIDTGMLLVQQSSTPLYHLAPQFQTPYLAVKCRLNGVICKSNSLEWSSRELEFFRKLFKPLCVDVVGYQSDVHVVDVILTDKRNLSTILIEAGMVEYIETEEYLQSVHSLITRTCYSRFDAVEESKLPRLHLTSVMKDLDSFEEHWININHVITPNQFWTNFLSDSISELEQLESDLKEHCDKQHCDKFMVNIYENLYAAKCGSTGSWKRVSIIGMKDTKASIFFLDYGYRSSTSLKYLLPLHTKFTSLPLQAVCCSIGLEVSTWQKQHVEYFSSLTKQTIFHIKITKKLDDRIVIDFVSEDSIKANLLSFVKASENDFVRLIEKRGESTKRESEKISNDEQIYKYLPNKSLARNDMVLIDNIESTSDFYVVQLDEERMKMFQHLMVELKDFCSSSNDPEGPIVPDATVACLFENVWSRAQVLNCFNDNMELFLVDFGKRHVTERNKVKLIPKKFVDDLHVQSLHCSIELTERTQTCEMWFKNNCEGSISIIESAEMVDGKYVVDIRIDGDDESLAKKFIKMNSDELDSKPYNDNEFKNFNGSSNNVIHGNDNTSRNSDEGELMLEENCSVLVVHINSLSEFYVQKNSESAAEILRDLTSQLNQCPLPPCKNVKVKQLVAAEFEKVWYRAVVEDILQDDTVKVSFVDFGNKEAIKKDLICSIKDRNLIEAPFVVQLCCLNICPDQISSSASVLDHFTEICLNKLFVVKNLRIDSKNKCHVDLVNSMTAESVCDLLKQVTNKTTHNQTDGNHDKLCIRKICEEVSKSSCSSPNKESSLVVKQDIPIPTGCSVTILYSINPSDFYINEASSSGDLLELVKCLNNYCSKASKNSHPKRDEVVAALFESVWYRAKVLDILPNERFRLKFTDYGNIEEVEGKEILNISQELQSMNPKPSVHCRLVINRDDPPSFEWNEESIEWFRENCEWKTYKLSSIRQNGIVDVDDAIFNVELHTSEDDVPLVDVLIKNNIFPAKKAEDEQDERNERSFLSDLGSLNFEGSTRCEVILPTNPGEFWCQDIDSMVALLGENKFPNPSRKEYVPIVDEVCMVFYPEFNDWYRAVVKEVEMNQADVHLIDYEDDITVPFNHILHLPLSLKKYPPLAFLCSLDDMSPTSSPWSSKAIEYFQSLVAEQIVRVTVIKCSGLIKYVDVINAQQVSVAEKFKAFKSAK